MDEKVEAHLQKGLRARRFAKAGHLPMMEGQEARLKSFSQTPVDPDTPNLILSSV